jgi:hypothetical protein
MHFASHRTDVCFLYFMRRTSSVDVLSASELFFGSLDFRLKCSELGLEMREVRSSNVSAIGGNGMRRR